MGVIKRLLFSGDLLNTPRHRNMFLDMEENIHIHFRDLRLELSRGEFEDIVAVFTRQSRELLALIRENEYQDGMLPNANQEDVRIWTESRLRHDVKYNPRKLSLEECGDGYHLHYRNYKILIDPDEFRALVQAFKDIDLDTPYASAYHEVEDLLRANEIDFMLSAGNQPGKVLAISVAKHHLAKVRDIFGYIGFAKEKRDKEVRYIGPRLTVVVTDDVQYTARDYKRINGLSRTERLVDFLSRNSAVINPDELNLIKCQVLDLYSALVSGKSLHVETDPQLWLYARTSQQVVFPYNVTPHGGKQDAASLYKAWSTLLAGLDLTFVKPTKEPFATTAQQELRKKVDEFLAREVASCIAVDKVHLMGSAKRGDMGRYHTPFVHGRLAKLGSDVDILVEINPAHEQDLSGHWHLYSAQSSHGCPVYHMGQIPFADDWGEWQARYPHIQFTEHLVDAYVFLPSRGNHQDRDAFLKKFGAQCVYDRSRDGITYRGKDEERIAGIITEQYGFSNVIVEKMIVSTENALYKIFADNQSLILKLFKVSGNYSRSRVAEHVAYEKKLVSQLKERGIPTAGVLPSQDEHVVVNGFPALLFERIPGTAQQRPEYPLETIGPALARIHGVQMEQPLALDEAFTFDDICMIWLPQFSSYLKNTLPGREIAEAFKALIPLVNRYNPGEYRARMYANSPCVHNHGDVTPKNLIISEQGQVFFFDFNNAYFGPRMADIIDGAFEFSLAEKYIHLADFSRFDGFLAAYDAQTTLTPAEHEDLEKWIELMGCIKFTKEIRVLLERPKEKLRRRRALAIAEFVLSRTGPNLASAA
ncbi:phosphotransferase enzyme family protein [Desulfonatronum thiodismutans]|uniref:phosphotransferase enzyme family protein n=1 Tax=Desulfonatronum thiodismutans TaxID=159290 RepID=UPI001268C705|nr:phosphotransferase [Desulfonatronum thiodismutans]